MLLFSLLLSYLTRLTSTHRTILLPQVLDVSNAEVPMLIDSSAQNQPQTSR